MVSIRIIERIIQIFMWLLFSYKVTITNIQKNCQEKQDAQKTCNYSGYQVHGLKFTVSRFALFFISLKIVNESTNGSPAPAGFVWPVRGHYEEMPECPAWKGGELHSGSELIHACLCDGRQVPVARPQYLQSI